MLPMVRPLRKSGSAAGELVKLARERSKSRKVPGNVVVAVRSAGLGSVTVRNGPSETPRRLTVEEWFPSDTVTVPLNVVTVLGVIAFGTGGGAKVYPFCTVAVVEAGCTEVAV